MKNKKIVTLTIAEHTMLKFAISREIFRAREKQKKYGYSKGWALDVRILKNLSNKLKEADIIKLW